jgi:hypothetical protein
MTMPVPKKTYATQEPADGGFALTPNDSTVLTGVRAIYVGGAGTVRIEFLHAETSGATTDFIAQAGAVLPCVPLRVLATGTTATGLVALR